MLNCSVIVVMCLLVVFFFQAEDGIRDLVRSRGLGDVYKRQGFDAPVAARRVAAQATERARPQLTEEMVPEESGLSLIHI